MMQHLPKLVLWIYITRIGWWQSSRHCSFLSSKKFQSIKIWEGIILPPQLNRILYLEFLQDFDDLRVTIRENTFFRHNGDPPHYSVAVWYYLNNVIPNRWTARCLASSVFRSNAVGFLPMGSLQNLGVRNSGGTSTENHVSLWYDKEHAGLL